MSHEARVRIVIADDHPLFALGLRALLQDQPGFDVVGESYEGVQAIELVRRLTPDILLLDLDLPRVNGLEVLKRLEPLNLPTRVVLMAADIDRQRLTQAVIRGARGVLLKHTASDLLPKCIHQVLAGEYWITRDSVAEVIDELRTATRPIESDYGLSDREIDIVTAVVKGASNKEVAWQLGLGEQTVKNHLRRIFAKLHVSNRVELALQATSLKVVPSDQGGAVPLPPGIGVAGSPTRDRSH
jgi:DNA-binding NarL/FixJ family response regulator